MYPCHGCPLDCANCYCQSIRKLFTFSHRARDCPVFLQTESLLDDSAKLDFFQDCLMPEEVDLILNYLFDRGDDQIWIDEMMAGGLPDYNLSLLINLMETYLDHVKHSRFFRRDAVLMLNRLLVLLNEYFLIEQHEPKFPASLSQWNVADA